MKNKILVVFFNFSLFLKLTDSFLDLDELQSIQYGIDIVGNPVVIGQEQPAGSVTLTTKFGQQYQCSYPNQAEENAKQKEEEKEAEEIGIVELLKPMESGPCLIHTKGWWTYEFCYGRDIKQYHMEEGKPSGIIMYLGYYESEFDWSNSTQAEKKRKSRLNRYHSQQYVNGTTCDITSKPRRSEVRFQCEEGKGDYVSNIDESESCVYVINVKTTKICHHPYLKPPVKKTPVPITCNPLLTTEQYDEYLADQEAEQLAKEERQREREKYYESQNVQKPQGPEDSLMEGGKVDTEPNEDKRDDEKMVNSAVEALEKLFVESLSKGLQSVLNDANEKAFETDYKKKKVDGDNDEDSTELDEGTLEERETIDGDSARPDKANDESPTGDLMDATDREAVQAFEKEFDEIAKTDAHKEHISQYRDNIESAVSAQFNDIVKEAQAEIGEEEGVEIDKTEAFAQLAKTLNKLMNKLEHTEKEIEEIDNRIEHAEKIRDDLKKEVREDELENEDKEDDDLLIYTTEDGKNTEAAQNLNTDTPHTADRQTDTGDTVDNMRPDTPIAPDDGQVKVRIVKIAEKATGNPSVEKADTESPPSQKHLDIPKKKKVPTATLR